METVEAKWVVAGDAIVAGIDFDEQSEIKLGLALTLKNKEDLGRAMRGDVLVLIKGADF